MGSVLDLKALIERKKAEQEVTRKAAAEARQAAAATTPETPKQPRKERKAIDLEFRAAKEKTAKEFAEAKELILELLDFSKGNPDEETQEALTKQFAEFHGLEQAVIEAEMLGSTGYPLSHWASQQALKLDAFVAITEGQEKEASERNRAVYTHKENKGDDHPKKCSECLLTFVYKSKDSTSTVHRYVTADEGADWLKDVLRERHEYKKGVEKDFGKVIAGAGANHNLPYAERVLLLQKIARGENAVVVATITKDNPFTTPRYEGDKRVGEFVNFGDFLVRGLGIEEGGTLPTLELVPFDREHSRMYHVVSKSFNGIFKYEAAKDDKPDRAFYGLQDKSKKPADHLRALLRKALGAKLERRDSSGKLQTSTGVAFTKAQDASKVAPPVLPEAAVIRGVETTKAPSRSARREQDKTRKASEGARPRTEDTDEIRLPNSSDPAAFADPE